MIEKFRALINELASNPNVKVLTYKEYSPLKAIDIEGIEQKLSLKLPKELKDFYLQTNGLSLGWIHKNDTSADFSKLKAIKLPNDMNKLQSKKAPEYRASYTNQSGSIEIKSLKDVFSSAFPMNELLNNEGFYVFDAFSNITGAALSIVDSKKWMVSFNSDYYTHFDDYSNAMTFSKYLQFLIDSKGIKSLRNNQKNINLLENDLSSWPATFAYYE